MAELTILERVRLSKVRRQILSGERDESAFNGRERDWLDWLDFLAWRKRQGFDCVCGLSDGEKCYCEEGT